jgi:hypothetical protein
MRQILAGAQQFNIRDETGIYWVLMPLSITKSARPM